MPSEARQAHVERCVVGRPLVRAAAMLADCIALYQRRTGESPVKLARDGHEASPMPKSNARRKKPPKRVLALPDLES